MQVRLTVVQALPKNEASPRVPLLQEAQTQHANLLSGCGDSGRSTGISPAAGTIVQVTVASSARRGLGLL